MAVDLTLQTLLRELMAIYDPSVDTTDGSSFDQVVAQPFLERIGPSILDGNLEERLAATVRARRPDLQFTADSVLYDVLVRVGLVLLEPFRRELAATRALSSLSNANSWTRDELNARLANYFISLNDGTKSTGTARVYYSTPIGVTFGALTRFSTATSLAFYPTESLAVSAEQMRFQQQGDLYYVDVPVTAEEAGSAYVVEANTPLSVVGLSGVVKAVMRFRTSEATEPETKEAGVQRAENSITQHTLSTERGINFVIPGEFKDTQFLQVIRAGDPEMVRDLIYGPVALSSIPGGFGGPTPPSVSLGAAVHVGGHTDAYVHRGLPTESSLTLENIADVGFRVWASASGFTIPGTSTTTFNDDFGNFSGRGVQVGDTLRIGSSQYRIQSVSQSSLELGASTAGGQFGVVYEIVRTDPSVLRIPLYDLVAEADGAAIVDANDAPVMAMPGSASRAPVLDSDGDYITTQENVSSSNVLLPILRVSSIAMLDPISTEETGDTIPLGEILLADAIANFTGGATNTKATGTARVWFQDAVNAWVSPSALFVANGSKAFEPSGTSTMVVSGNSGDSSLTIAGNVVSSVPVGYRLMLPQGAVMVVSRSYTAPNTTVVIREELTGDLDEYSAALTPGVRQASMSQDATTGLYYWDVPVRARAKGAGYNLDAGTEMTVSGLTVEGYRLRSSYKDVSFSMRDLPYLEISRWVNDDTDLMAETAYSIQVNYDVATGLKDVQTFVNSDDEEVVCEDLLVRAFRPVYTWLRTGMQGITAADAVGHYEDYLAQLSPGDDLIASSISGYWTDPRKGGATSVTLPFTVVAVEYLADRTLRLSRSEDRVSSDRTALFFSALAAADLS